MKIVNESLLELYKFEKKNDSLASIGVGKKVIIEKWLNKMLIENYKINDDFTIDIKGSCYLNNRYLENFPDYIQFNKVQADFHCGWNFLTSLRGCPKYCLNFYCNNNKLTSLNGCPGEVKMYFWCSNNDVLFSKDDVLELCNVYYDNIIVEDNN
jgi:hypothetical protein